MIIFVTDLKVCFAKGAIESTHKGYLLLEFSVDTRICIDAGIDGFVETRIDGIDKCVDTRIDGIDRSKILTNCQNLSEILVERSIQNF